MPNFEFRLLEKINKGEFLPLKIIEKQQVHIQLRINNNNPQK